MQSARGRLVVRDDDLLEVEERLRCFCCSAVLNACSLFVVGKSL